MKAKYDLIGLNYNSTRKADTYLVDRLIQHLNPEKEKLYLDIGCGTGNYTCNLQEKGFRFIGIDPSNKMLEKAQQKNKQIDWQIGTAEQTGLEDQSIDGIIGFLTIHHWVDLNKGFSELYRVLKENSKIVIFTSTPKQMKGYWLNRYFPKMLSDSIIQMPTYKSVSSALENAGFKISRTENYSIKSDLQDKFLYCGKYNPEIYLDEAIRQGISSFSSLANQKEVEKGLAKLQSDINNKRIQKIIDSYKNNFGDYIFFIGEKGLN